MRHFGVFDNEYYRIWSGKSADLNTTSLSLNVHSPKSQLEGWLTFGPLIHEIEQQLSNLLERDRRIEYCCHLLSPHVLF